MAPRAACAADAAPADAAPAEPAPPDDDGGCTPTPARPPPLWLALRARAALARRRRR
ncbi:MAG: hypothetical protein H6705_12950 [Myxococcales bacterium]|nr:hypothetical protein [Myxococcales bacterium]